MESNNLGKGDNKVNTNSGGVFKKNQRLNGDLEGVLGNPKLLPKEGGPNAAVSGPW